MKEWGELIDPAARLGDDKVFDLLNVRYLIAKRTADGRIHSGINQIDEKTLSEHWRMAAQFDDIAVYENTHSQPRAWLATQAVDSSGMRGICSRRSARASCLTDSFGTSLSYSVGRCTLKLSDVERLCRQRRRRSQVSSRIASGLRTIPRALRSSFLQKTTIPVGRRGLTVVKTGSCKSITTRGVSTLRRGPTRSSSTTDPGRFGRGLSCRL